MGSYLVFSAYQFLLCGLRVMCFPNLIISDPDFHLHVGGLLNPIPGKLFSILLVLCSILFEELLCSQKLTGGYLCIWRECWTRKCTLTSTQLYMKWKDVNTQTRTNLNTWRNAHLSCSFLPVFLPLFLCLVIVLCSNPLCSLQFHLKSFPSLNKILHLSLCLSCSSSLPTLFPLYLLLFLLLPWPLCHLSSLLPYSFFLFPFFFFSTFSLPLHRLSVWNQWMGWDYSLQSGGWGRESETWRCSGLYLDHQGSSTVQGQYKGPY